MRMIIKQLLLEHNCQNRCLLLLAFHLYTWYAYSQTLNPLDFGLKEAKNGIERFHILELCHTEAVSKGADVSYQGVDEIILEVPIDAKPIPLSRNTDFCGVHIRIANNSKDMTLFELTNTKRYVKINGSELCKGTRLSDEVSRSGAHMLVVQDDSLWVYRRKNKSYGAVRRDILCIENGIVRNNPVADYSTISSRPIVYVVDKDTKDVDFGNLSFERDASSTMKTFLVRFINVHGITLHDICIQTPTLNDLYGDRAIYVENATNLSLNAIRIEGTYSQPNHSGYGVELNNVYDLHVNRMYARSNWGIFGNNNIHKAVLTDCDINRFDIHCYGRDVKSVRCKYSDMYNQFSSIYGKVEFEDCEFSNFRPVLMESSYNAYTPFDISFKQCTFNMNEKNNYLVTLLGLEEAHNSRPELSRKALPNITIKDCVVNLPDGLKEWYVVNTGKVRYKETLDYMSHITINGLTINQPSNFDLFSTEVTTTTPLKVLIENMYEVKDGKCKKYIMPHATVDDKATVKCNGKAVRRKTPMDSFVSSRAFPLAVGSMLLAGCLCAQRRMKCAA